MFWSAISSALNSAENIELFLLQAFDRQDVVVTAAAATASSVLEPSV